MPHLFEEFSRVNRTRCEAPDGFNHKLQDWSLSDWMTALVGEIGEAANLIKKLNRHKDGIRGNTEEVEALRAKLADELADAFIYLDLLSQRASIDLSLAVTRAFNNKSTFLGCSIKWGQGKHA